MDGQRQMMNRKKKNVKTFVSSERKNQTPVTTRAPLKDKNITLDALNGRNLRSGLHKLKLCKKETGFGNVKKDQIVIASIESKSKTINTHLPKNHVQKSRNAFSKAHNKSSNHMSTDILCNEEIHFESFNNDGNGKIEFEAYSSQYQNKVTPSFGTLTKLQNNTDVSNSNKSQIIGNMPRKVKMRPVKVNKADNLTKQTLTSAKPKHVQSAPLSEPENEYSPKYLRLRRAKTYAETSNESPQIKQVINIGIDSNGRDNQNNETKKHIPIYKQLKPSPEKKLGDLYEFEIEKEVRSNKKKRVSDESFKIVERKKKGLKKARDKNDKVYNKKIQVTLRSILNKINTNKGVAVNQSEKNCERKISNNLEPNIDKNKKLPGLGNTLIKTFPMFSNGDVSKQETATKNSDIRVHINTDRLQKRVQAESDITVASEVSRVSYKIHEQAKLSDENMSRVNSEDGALVAKQVNQNMQKENTNFGEFSVSHSNIDSDSSHDYLTDFDLDPNDENRINVIDNTSITAARFDNDGPNANSTFCSPWRFNCEYITRNPHFVVVKPNALPSVDQEAVLDHTFVEELEKDCEYIKPSNPKRSPIQQNIRKYLKLDDDKENSCSFFDASELSPIRIRENSNSVRELDTSSKSPTKTPKRKVLGNIDLNHMDVIKCGEFSPPRRSIFGFNSTSEERGSPVIIRGDAKPFRLYLPTEKEKPRPILEEETVSSKSGQNQEAKHEICLELRDSQREVNEEATTIGLFEDIEEKKPLRCYIKKRRKKRLRSVDYDDNELENTRKKHKEKENPELEKWAKEFNSMCEEIDKDELEIE